MQQPMQQYGAGMTPQPPQTNNAPYAYNAGNSLYQNNMNQFALRDKTDQGAGLVQKNPQEVSVYSLGKHISC